MCNDEILSKLEKIESLLGIYNPNKTVYTLKEAAQYLGLSESYFYKVLSGRKIAYHKPNGKLVYLHKADLDQFLTRNRHKTHDEIEAEAENYLVKQSAQSK